jgi:hypothetical protein
MRPGNGEGWRSRTRGKRGVFKLNRGKRETGLGDKTLLVAAPREVALRRKEAPKGEIPAQRAGHGICLSQTQKASIELC